MTDYEQLTAMFGFAGIVFETDPERTFVQTEAGAGPKNEGYAGFATTFTFKPDGSLESIGAWEG